MSSRRVAVAKGGTSIEREVSLRGAHRVTAALRQAGYDVTEVEIDHTVLDRVREVAPAFVFIVAHGRNGEDGSLQALLELLEVPFTGSDSLASALCIDKILTKRLLQRAGLPTPPFHAFSRRTFQDLGAATVFDEVMASLGAPVVVKPARMGSSFGIKFVSHPDQLRTAVLGSVAYDDEILVEQHVAGRELAVTVIGGRSDPEHPGPPGHCRSSRSSPLASSTTTRRTTTSTSSGSPRRPDSTTMSAPPWRRSASRPIARLAAVTSRAWT